MDNTKPTAQILGRFNPWNTGHRALFDTVLNKADYDKQPRERQPTSEAHQVCIMVRDMGKNNFEKIKSNIEADLEEDYSGRYIIIQVPNITNVFYGRQVGFDVDRVDLPSHLEPVENRKKIRAEETAKSHHFWQGRQ